MDSQSSQMGPYLQLGHRQSMQLGGQDLRRIRPDTCSQGGSVLLEVRFSLVLAHSTPGLEGPPPKLTFARPPTDVLRVVPQFSFLRKGLPA
jgi:hypothetical protein